MANKARMAKIVFMAYVPDQRPRATDGQNETRALWRGSLQLACSAIICPYSLTRNQCRCVVHLHSDDEPAALESPICVHPLSVPVQPPVRVRLNANRGEVVL